MTMLYLNHGATGILNWVFHTTPELENAASKMAQVLTLLIVARLILGGRLVKIAGVDGDDGNVDVAAWMSEDRGTLLVSIVNPGRQQLNVNSISLAAALNGGTATGIGTILWGNSNWMLSSSNRLTSSSGVPLLSVDLLTLTVKGGLQTLDAPHLQVLG